MRNLLHIFNFKATAILFSLMLTACGSGGGGLDLGGGGGGGCNNTPITAQPLQGGGSLQSTDKRATVTNPDTSPINLVTITVDCSNPPDSRQIGRGYAVSFSGSGQLAPILTVSYKDLLGSVLESTLQLGDYDSLADDWIAEEAAVQEPDNDLFRLTLADPNDVRYAVYTSTTGGGNDTTPPSQPTITSISKSPGTITIAWTASTDDASGVVSYLINRTPDPGAQIDATNGTTLSYSDTGGGIHPLVAGTTYCYTVAAVDGSPNANRSLPSAQKCIAY